METNINFKGLNENTTIKDLRKMEIDFKDFQKVLSETRKDAFKSGLGFKFNFTAKEKALKELEEEHNIKNSKDVLESLGVVYYE